jgi:MATE family multidrug resistance protein
MKERKMDTDFRRSEPKRRRTAKFFIILGFGFLNLTNSGVRCFAIGRNDNSQQPQHHLNPTSSKRRRQDNNNKNNNLYRSQSLANLNSIAKQNGNGESHIDKRSYCYTNGRLQATQSDDDNHHIDQIANIGNNVTAVSDDTKIDQRQLKEGIWPCMDKLDRELIKISLPVIGNYAIGPLIGAVDLFWVNRMGNALAVAGQSAANQVFSSAFWFVSFLPSVTATLVAKQHAKGDKEATQDAICQALFVGFFIAMIGTPAMFFFSEGALSSVLQKGAPAMQYAKPYLLIRAFAFLPSLISLVGFSAFRGILDTKTPVKISAFANVFNAVLDPILIFSLAMGVPGAALATLAAEVISAVVYLGLLRKRQLISWVKLFRPPTWASLQPLLQGGLALQLRNLSLNLTFLAVARVTQSIDQSGVAAAAHAMAIQTFQIGGIVLLAVSTVAQIMVPNAMVERYDEGSKKTIGGLRYAKATSNRLMSWGFVLGCALGSLQILLLPVMFKTTPLQEVRDAAKLPAIIASILQIINGLVFIGEGIMIGTGSFLQLSISTLIATAGCLWALWFFPPRVGLTGVWLGFGVFNMLRLVGVYIHQRINGPLSWRKIEQKYANSN